MTRIRKSAKSAARRPPKSPSLTPSETQICQSFLDFVQKAFPEYRPDIIKIDNEGRTSWQEGARKKREGKKKGASDYFVAVPRYKGWQGDQTVSHGLWLEVKKTGGRESPEQKEFGRKRIERGYQYRCVYGIDEAIAVVSEYLKGG